MSGARSSVIPALTCAVALFSNPSSADDDVLSCRGKLVSPGVDIAFVLERCGEPTERVKESVPQLGRRANGTTFVSGTINVERWTYDFGSSRFPALLKFEEGRLVSVEFLRR